MNASNTSQVMLILDQGGVGPLPPLAPERRSDWTHPVRLSAQTEAALARRPDVPPWGPLDERLEYGIF